MHARWAKVAIFYGATFSITHVLSLGYVLSGGSRGSPGSYAVANGLMLCPASVAVGLQRFAYRDRIIEPLGLRFRPTRWFALAWLFPPAVMLLALGIALLVPGARYAPDMSGLPPEMASFREQIASVRVTPVLAMLRLGLAMGPTLNAIGGLGEEIGWRGFIYKELAPLGFWKCSLLTGALWALLHVPLSIEGYGDRDHPVASALGMAAFVILLAPLLHFVRFRSFGGRLRDSARDHEQHALA